MHTVKFFLDIDDCQSQPCQNSETCHDLVNDYRYDCVAGFNYINCENSMHISWRLFLHGQTPLILAINCIVTTIYCVLLSSGGGNGYLFLNIGSLFHFAKGIGNMIVCVTINRKVNLKKLTTFKKKLPKQNLVFLIVNYSVN